MPMISPGQLAAIAVRHGHRPPADVPEPWIGAASHVYLVDDVVVKIPFNRPDTIEAVTTDAAVSPLVRALGVSAPVLIALDETREVVPWMMEGHREIALLPDDASAETRVLWCQVPMRFFVARRAPEDAPIDVDVDAIHRFADAEVPDS